MCALNSCLVSSYQHLLLSFITHSLLAPSIHHSQVPALAVRVCRYCSAGEARELHQLLVSCLGSLSALLGWCPGVGELAWGRCSSLGCTVSGTWCRWLGPGPSPCPFLFTAGLWHGGTCQTRWTACLACVFRVLILSGKSGKDVGRDVLALASVFWKLCSAMPICELWSAR